MKNEIKTLYKRDSKLAIEVANVLGFKIKAATPPEVKKAAKLTKEIEKVVNKAAQDLFSTYRKAYKSLKIEVSPQIEQVFDKLDSILVKSKIIVNKNILDQVAKQIVDKATKKGKE